MQSSATTPEQYLNELPEDRKKAMQKLRDTFIKKLPAGFEEIMQYGMLGYVVPHSIYPEGYHCNPKDPLPFLGIASQKNHIAVYHMGIYTDPALLKWFTTKYEKTIPTKLDMGKSCIRFKNQKNIPFELLGELATKMTVEEWIEKYNELVKK